MVMQQAYDIHPYLQQVKPNELGFIGESASMEKVYRLIRRVGKSLATVNVAGESGTGKELVAKALHQLSGRNNFRAINCGSFNESLLESELFGVGNNVATGVHRKTGILELAHHGTLFLDEVADMSPKMQNDLLRVIQEKEFFRVGEHIPIKVDVRIITASSRPLETFVREGKFREDLYYRLSVVPIEIPPLREREKDVMGLAKYFFGKFCVREGRELFMADNLDRTLLKYPWPGNVRELENVMERVVVLYESEDIILREREFDFLKRNNDYRFDAEGHIIGEVDLGITLSKVKVNLERAYIDAALIKTRGNVSEASVILGFTDRSSLHRLMREYGIDANKYRIPK